MINGDAVYKTMNMVATSLWCGAVMGMADEAANQAEEFDRELANYLRRLHDAASDLDAYCKYGKGAKA